MSDKTSKAESFGATRIANQREFAHGHEAGALNDMAAQAQTLADAVVGHKIVAVSKEETTTWRDDSLVLTLDTGRKVLLTTTSDCCAWSELTAFLHNADSIDHIITKVVTDDEFEKWYILADLHQVLALDLSWSEGNYPYYSFGFDIEVRDA